MVKGDSHNMQHYVATPSYDVTDYRVDNNYGIFSGNAFTYTPANLEN